MNFVFFRYSNFATGSSPVHRSHPIRRTPIRHGLQMLPQAKPILLPRVTQGIKTFYTRPSGSAHSSSDLSSPDLPPSRTPSPLLTPIEGTAKSPGKIYAGTTGGVKLDPATLSRECYTEETETKNEEAVEKVEEATEDLSEERQNMGVLNLSIEYNNEKSVFVVTIHRASYLPAKDPQSGTSDPYIKLCLLPEKKHKVKTRVLRKTLTLFMKRPSLLWPCLQPTPGITLHFIVMSLTVSAVMT
ncbi:putative synaptotagmin-4 [Apostichopus japonicus]|uniref:Putative synaptotagmin-4 n=1 Tax=Stichopus japonicus TaxID=307972 RepID=A0A2G8KZ91_STIJA|nr:putative synaptotagmin-4 [Apostichopus japonicus]